MTQWLTSNEKIITFVFNILQTLAIPVVLFLLNQHNEKRKEIEQQRKEELERIKIYYDEHLKELLISIPNILPSVSMQILQDLISKMEELQVECDLNYLLIRYRTIYIKAQQFLLEQGILDSIGEVGENINDEKIVEIYYEITFILDRKLYQAMYNDWEYKNITGYLDYLREPQRKYNPNKKKKLENFINELARTHNKE